MVKINPLSTISVTYDTTTLNANFDEIELALQNTLSRDGSSPNAMDSTLDMDSNLIINLVEATTATEPVRYSQLNIAALTDIDLTGLSDGDALVWDESASKWVPGSVAASGGGGAVESVNGNTGVVVLDTDDISEGAVNLYYTQGRFDSAFTAKSTTDLSEGTNLYYTQGRFDSAFTAKSTTDLSEGTNLYYTDIRVDARIALASVTDLSDVTDAGSGIIISDAERTKLSGALVAANNLSDVASASTARTNLGLVIGTDVQAFDTELAAIAGLTSAADRVPYYTGSGTASLAVFTSAGRALLDDADADAQRDTLGIDYTFSETVYYTTSGSFTKASYPGIKGVEVTVVGGGGAGGGAASTSAGEQSCGGGGGSGAFAREFILESALSASETVTVGAGGTGVSGAGGNNGSASSFGSHVSANGGNGGNTRGASANLSLALPGAGGSAGATGDMNAAGSGGDFGYRRLDTAVAYGGRGGSSFFGGAGAFSNANGTTNAGNAGSTGGGGGGATSDESASAAAGGAGGAGIVIVKVYV